jgi:S1-C subfamily serine protease
MRILFALLLIVLGFLGGMAWKKYAAAPEQETNANALLVNNGGNPPTVNTALLGEREVIGQLTPEETHTIRLFEGAAASVCFITTSNVRRDYFSRDVTEIPRGSGSGFVWNKSGHIVTNYHVLQGADKAQITLSDRTSYTAELVGIAPEKDLAVLRIDAPASKLFPIPVGSSERLLVGQAVYAIGNPFGLDQTLTTGIVSALGREIESVSGIPIRDVIQTDAAINPGNSGGPLLNSSGELIGVNTAIYSPSGASAGIGFSIPADAVRWVVPELIQYGKIKRPTLGVELARPLRNIEGALVYDVVTGGAAARAGVKPTTVDRNGNIILGDIIVRFNNERIASNNDLILALEKYNPGDQVELVVVRNERETRLRVVLDAAR